MICYTIHVRYENSCESLKYERVDIVIAENITFLRKRAKLTQEELAEQINVSRQAVAKWEKGEAVPDVYNCAALADVFDVTVDELISKQDDEFGLGVPPKGKYFFGVVKVGERGQIVIPKKASDVFKIEAGDSLIVVGDEERGIAIVPQKSVFNFLGMTNIFGKDKKK